MVIPMEINILHVVVFKIGFKIEIISVWEEILEEDLTCSERRTYPATYEPHK